jgi:hypothetical protein
MREVERPLRTTDFEGREGPDQIPPLGLVSSAALFAVGALLLFLTTRLAVPTLVSATGAEPVVMWFLAASAVLFGPLLLTAALVLHRERRTGRPGPWVARLWLHPMKGGDWLWAIGGLAVVGVLTGGIGSALGALAGKSTLHPSFMAFEPLGPGRYWISCGVAPVFCAQHRRGRVRMAECRAAAARGCLRGEGLAGQWDPLVALPRCVLVAGPGNPCADHVDPALRRPAAAQYLGRGDYPRRVRRDGLSRAGMRTCLRVRTAANPAAAADGGRGETTNYQEQGQCCTFC